MATVIEVNGINIHYKLEGPENGPTIVFSNSLGTAMRVWDGVVSWLPKNFKKTGLKRYPLMIFHGHFPNTFRGFRNKPPDAPKKDSIYNERFGITGYKFIQENEAYNLHNKWLSKNFRVQIPSYRLT